MLVQIMSWTNTCRVWRFTVALSLMQLSYCSLCLWRVLADHYPPDEGIRPSGIREGDTHPLPNAQSEYPPATVMGRVLVQITDSALSVFPAGGGFHALGILQRLVQQVHDGEHHSENGVCWSASLQHLWAGSELKELMTQLTVFSKNSGFKMFSLIQQNLTMLCHLDQLLLVTHINLSSNQLQRLPPHFAMLQCLEVNVQKHFQRSHCSVTKPTYFMLLWLFMGQNIQLVQEMTMTLFL